MVKQFKRSGVQMPGFSPALPSPFRRSSHVPSIIHQTFSSSSLSPAYSENVRTIRAMNPEYEYRFYDDRQALAFVLSSYGQEVAAIYNSISPRYGAARADLFRYLLLYKEGGVYLDIKSTTITPLREVIKVDDQFLLSQWENGIGDPYEGYGLHPELVSPRGEYQQWHIICAAGHPFLRSVITRVLRNLQTYRSWHHGVGRLGTVRVTGPIAFTLAIDQVLKEADYRLVRSETELGLRYTIFDHHLEHTRMSRSHYHWNISPLVNHKGWLGILSHGDYIRRRIIGSSKLNSLISRVKHVRRWTSGQ